MVGEHADGFELRRLEHVSFVDGEDGGASAFGLFVGDGVQRLGDEGGVVGAGHAAEGGDDGVVDAADADGRVGQVDQHVAGLVESGQCGPEGDGLAGADSDSDRLQHLRAVLPCDVDVVDETHPLCGERLKAMSFRRRRGELRLVVVLPDGTPGMVAANATDVFGAGGVLPAPLTTTLTVEGVRSLRTQVERSSGSARPSSGRAKPWKVVRHRHGVDPFDRLEWVYSAHTTERAAQRARDQARAVLARSSGEAEARRWAWSVLDDPAELLSNPTPQRDAPGADVRR